MVAEAEILLRPNVVEIDGTAVATATVVEKHPQALQRAGVWRQTIHTVRSSAKQRSQFNCYRGTGSGVNKPEAGLAPVEVAANLHRNGLRSAGGRCGMSVKSTKVSLGEKQSKLHSFGPTALVI
jgi:hypothetical protein